MDALARLEPVARPLLRQIDDALVALGAPPAHEIWQLLRQVGATPADAVAAFAELTGAESAGGLRVAADTVREQAERYADTTIPARVPWAGGAGDAYFARAVALAAYLHGDARGDIAEDGDSMAARLVATASYVDDVADWQSRSRNRIARALAEVLTSAQAVALRAAAATSSPGGSAPAGGQVEAAADAGAHLLAAAADALTDGRDVQRAWADRLAELPYRGTVDAGPSRFDAAIRLNH